MASDGRVPGFQSPGENDSEPQIPACCNGIHWGSLYEVLSLGSASQ